MGIRDETAERTRDRPNVDGSDVDDKDKDGDEADEGWTATNAVTPERCSACAVPGAESSAVETKPWLAVVSVSISQLAVAVAAADSIRVGLACFEAD